MHSCSKTSLLFRTLRSDPGEIAVAHLAPVDGLAGHVAGLPHPVLALLPRLLPALGHHLAGVGWNIKTGVQVYTAPGGRSAVWVAARTAAWRGAGTPPWPPLSRTPPSPPARPVQPVQSLLAVFTCLHCWRGTALQTGPACSLHSCTGMVRQTRRSSSRHRSPHLSCRWPVRDQHSTAAAT